MSAAAFGIEQRPGNPRSDRRESLFFAVFGAFSGEKGTQKTFTNDQLSVSSMFGNPALNDLSGAANGR